MPFAETFIYTLRDPRTFEVRYVGATQKPELRFYRHAKGHATASTRSWAQELRRMGLSPVPEIVETAGEDWAEREASWWRYHHELGAPLLNRCPKGQRVREAGSKAPPGTGAKIAAKNRISLRGNKNGLGHTLDEEHRRAISERVRKSAGWKHTEETKAKFRERRLSEEHKQAISAVQRGLKWCRVDGCRKRVGKGRKCPLHSA